MDTFQTRRNVLAGIAAVGPAPLFRRREALLEITSVRFARSPGICLVLQYVAEDMIRADGLSDFRYVDTQAGLTSTALLARGEVGFVVAF